MRIALNHTESRSWITYCVYCVSKTIHQKVGFGSGFDRPVWQKRPFFTFFPFVLLLEVTLLNKSKAYTLCFIWFWGSNHFFFFLKGNRSFIATPKENYKIKGDKASPTERFWRSKWLIRKRTLVCCILPARTFFNSVSSRFWFYCGLLEVTKERQRFQLLHVREFQWFQFSVITMYRG